MPTSPKPAPAKPRRRPARHPPLPPKPYHHADLKRVLIDAALLLAEEGGAEAVSVRAAARRAGVSPGAPFRHFPSRVALMTAVAALVYGFARMNIDGHFPRGGIAEADAERTAEAIIDLFIAGIAKGSGTA